MELRLGLAYEDSSEASTTTEATAAMEGTTSATEETTETFDHSIPLEPIGMCSSRYVHFSTRPRGTCFRR